MRSPAHAHRAYPSRSALTRPGALSLIAAVTVSGLVAAFALPATSASAGGPPVAATVVGTVERLHLDDFDHPLPTDADELTFVRTDGGSVQVPASDLAHVANGAMVRLGLADTTGTRPTAAGGLTADLTQAQGRDPQAGVDVATVDVVSSPQEGQVATGTGGTVTANTAVAAGVATHSVLVVVAQPPGGAATAVTPQALADTINTGVNSYWQQVTGGVVGFQATAYPSVIPTTNAPCTNGSVSSSSAFWAEVQQKSGWASGSGRHLVVYFPAYAACGGIAGLGSIGSGVASGGVVWSNGWNSVGVLGHELGHNLGLGHSQLLDCTVGGVRVTDAAAGSCTARSYADTNDIMAVAWNNQGFLNAVHLQTLGLLDAAAQAAPTDNGQVVLQPLEGGTGLRVLTLSDGGTHYVVEFRQPIGLDSWMSSLPGWGAAGVTVRREFDPSQPGAGAFSPIESYLLDGDPSTPDAGWGSMHNVLPTGAWIALADGRLGLRVESTSAAGAVVDYRNGTTAVDPRYVAPVRPTVSAPVSQLGSGTMLVGRSGPVVPITWTWQVATPSAAPGAGASVATSRSAASVLFSLKGWAATAHRAVAVASDGSSVTAVGRARTHYTSDTYSRVVKYTRGWAVARSATANGGTVRMTAKKGAVVAFRVTSRSVGVILARGPVNGAVAIYVDNRRVAVVANRTNRSALRVAWATTFPTTAAHTIKIVNLDRRVARVDGVRRPRHDGLRAATGSRCRWGDAPAGGCPHTPTRGAR